MTGWDISVYVAGAILIIGPIITFAVYLREMLRRIREDDFGSQSSGPKK